MDSFYVQSCALTNRRLVVGVPGVFFEISHACTQLTKAAILDALGQRVWSVLYETPREMA
jgi:hypothetical protein